MTIRNMTEQDAKAICSWQYPNEYAIYNLGYWNDIIKKNYSITNPDKRIKEYRSVYDNNDLIGYFRFKEDGNKIILGLGIKPDLCGNGLGKAFLNFILNSHELKNKLIELEVRTFNKRAIKSYLNAGFIIIKQMEKNTQSVKDTFIVMQKDN